MYIDSTTSLISVIVLNWNGQRLLQDCLGSLRKLHFQNFETILVDNGSTDDSVSYVKREFPEVRIVELEENLGFCAGNNRGVSVANGEYIFFLNNDTEVDPDMLGELYKAIQNDSQDVGSWTTKLLRWNQRDVIDHCGGGYSVFGTGYQIRKGELDDPTVVENEWVFGASGGAGCYRRSVLDEIGLFDEDFVFNNEDVDLAFRAQLAGYKCHYIAKSIVYHLGAVTYSPMNDNTVYHIHRNKEWVFFKNMPSLLLWKYLLLHVVYSLAWTLLWIVKGKSRVILRAKWDAIRAWRTVLKKRKSIQGRKRVSISYLDSMIDKRHLIRIWRSPLLSFRSEIQRNQ